MENQQCNCELNMSDTCAKYSAEIIEEFISDGTEQIKIYGIRIVSDSKICDEYRQITDSFEKISVLCGYLTEHDVDFGHIGYIIEDFISELHYYR